MKILKYSILFIILYILSTAITYSSVRLICAKSLSFTYSESYNKPLRIQHKSALGLMLNIFICNTFVCIFSIVGGFCIGRIIVILLPIINGIYLGFVLSKIPEEYVSRAIVYGILPHGIFETIALGISWSIGYTVANCETWSCFKKVLTQNRRYLIMTFILLIVAAFIEAYITPRLIELYLLHRSVH